MSNSKLLESYRNDAKLLAQQFTSSYEEMMDFLMMHFQKKELMSYADWLKELMSYNLGITTGRNIWGLIVPSIYVQIVAEEKFTLEDLKLCNWLGWCAELFAVSFLVADDVTDQSERRRGKPCWFRREDVGLRAVSDAFVLISIMFVILEEKCSRSPYFTEIRKMFVEVYFDISLGMSIDAVPKYPLNSPNFENWTMQRRTHIGKYKVSSGFTLMYRSALFVAGYGDPGLQSAIRVVVVKMGLLIHFENDFLDCYGDPELGFQDKDIENGLCTWLLLKALELCSSEHRLTLLKNYGRQSESALKRVKEVYDELNLKQKFLDFEKESKEEIEKDLQDFSRIYNIPYEPFLNYGKKRLGY